MLKYAGLFIFTLFLLWFTFEYTRGLLNRQNTYRALASLLFHIKEAFLCCPSPLSILISAREENELLLPLGRAIRSGEGVQEAVFSLSLEKSDRELLYSFLSEFGSSLASFEGERINTVYSHFLKKSADIESSCSVGIRTAWVLACTILFSVLILCL